MINIDIYQNKLSSLIEYMNYFIDKLAFNNTWYLRIITDIEIPFPDNRLYVKNDPDIELSNERWNEHPKQGWGKEGPDKMLGENIELWLLWKNTPINNFKRWIKLN